MELSFANVVCLEEQQGEMTVRISTLSASLSEPTQVVQLLPCLTLWSLQSEFTAQTQTPRSASPSRAPSTPYMG